MREINAVMPRDSGAAPLDFVIAVMAFLAALALGASASRPKVHRVGEGEILPPCGQS